jgi:sec-independent protein translocase protein TatB
MIRDAELADMETKWRDQNAAIMAQHPPAASADAALAEPALIGPDPGTVASLPPAPPQTQS